MNSTISGYIEAEKQVGLDDRLPEFESSLKLINRFKEITPDTRMFEIGAGSGWFQILCGMRGISCSGLELRPELAAYAQNLSRKYNIDIDVKVGNIEDTDIGTSKYDVIIANSVFEHVERWQEGLKRCFDALRPSGLLWFYSTNKFSFRQGEYDFPLYGWLPDSWRYRLRKALQGEDIMEYGIDFNQFTYFQLRRYFKHLGFPTILDHIDILDPKNLNNPTFKKKAVLKILKSSKLLKRSFLVFMSGTCFICIK